MQWKGLETPDFHCAPFVIKHACVEAFVGVVILRIWCVGYMLVLAKNMGSRASPRSSFPFVAPHILLGFLWLPKGKDMLFLTGKCCLVLYFIV